MNDISPGPPDSTKAWIEVCANDEYDPRPQDNLNRWEGRIRNLLWQVLRGRDAPDNE